MNSKNIKNQVAKDEIINKKVKTIDVVDEKKKIWYFKKILWKNEKDTIL